MNEGEGTHRTNRRAFLSQAGAATAGAALLTALPTFATARAAQTAAPAPKKGGTLTFGHIGDVNNYDPTTDNLDQFQNYGRLLLFSALAAYDIHLNLIPDLATSWEPQGKDWIFHLRKGVVWHDSSPFTANDVKYTFERTIDPKVGSANADTVGTTTTVDVLDPLTVRVKLPAVNASYPEQMVTVAIVKNNSGETNRAKPIGTGPFKFVSWSPNQQTVYARNEKYYNPDIPYLDQIIFRPTPDPQVAVTDLEAGSVQAISNQLVLPQTANQLAKQSGIKLVVVDPSTSLAYANLIQKKPPLSDVRVRQGLAMCLDMTAIKNLVYAGRGTPTNNIIPPLSWAYVNNPTYPYDPEKAKSLFAAAGFPNGFKTSIMTIAGYPDLVAIAPIWQDGMKKAGVEATVTTYDINVWLDRWNKGQYDISMNFDINGPDPQRMFYADILIHISNGEIADQTLVKQLTQGAAAAIATTDKQARKKIYANLQKLVYDELPTIPIYRPAIIAAVSDKIEGFAIDGKGYYHFERAWLSS